jgi:hypothetical protein
MDELKPGLEPSDSTVVATPVLRYGPQMDQELDAILKTLNRFLLKHPSFALTFAYLCASMMGLIFTISLLGEFQFNALPYLELTDFLLAAITHPMTVVFLILCILFVVVIGLIDRKCRKKYIKYAAWVDRYYSPSPWLPNWLIFAVVIAIYVWTGGTVEVDSLSRNIKQNKTPEYQLSLIYPIQPGGKEVRQLNEVQIITRTASYLWIYHQDQVKLIPHANVAALIPVVDKKPDKDLDKQSEGKAEKAAVAQETPVKEVVQQPAAVPVKS